MLVSDNYALNLQKISILMKNIAIFASGNGSNAEKIIEYFEGRKDTNISLICSNKASAYVLQRAENHNISSFIFNKQELRDFTGIDEVLKMFHIDFIVLAGFLLMIPKELIKRFPNKIINIHPALLPKYGGKGMYGMHVHETVIANNEKESGISIHFVNEIYDDGEIIFQAKCQVLPDDTAESLAERIHLLEHEHFPKVVDETVGKIC
jgi:phosphoribosylglycinamide formyltransferase-1